MQQRAPVCGTVAGVCTRRGGRPRRPATVRSRSGAGKVVLSERLRVGGRGGTAVPGRCFFPFPGCRPRRQTTARSTSRPALAPPPATCGHDAPYVFGFCAGA